MKYFKVTGLPFLCTVPLWSPKITFCTATGCSSTIGGCIIGGNGTFGHNTSRCCGGLHGNCPGGAIGQIFKPWIATSTVNEK